MSEPIIIAIVGAIAALVGGLVAGLFGRAKTHADADKSAADANEQIRETVMALIQPLKDRVAELEREVELLQCENAGLKLWAEALVAQLKKVGQEPAEYKLQKKPSKT